jgi:hypothetical protein
MDPDWESTCAQRKSTRLREADKRKIHTQREREESRNDRYLRVLGIVSQIVPAAPDVLGRVPDLCGEEQVVHLHIYKVPALTEKQPARHPREPDVRQGQVKTRDVVPALDKRQLLRAFKLVLQKVTAGIVKEK